MPISSNSRASEMVFAYVQSASETPIQQPRYQGRLGPTECFHRPCSRPPVTKSACRADGVNQNDWADTHAHRGRLRGYRDPRANNSSWSGALDFEQYEGGSDSVH